MDIDNPISTLPLIGPQYTNRLKRLNILTIRDLLYHFPFRYEDSSKIYTIKELSSIEPKTILAKLEDIRNLRIRGGRTIQKGTISDRDSLIEVVWFNQPYLADSLRPGEEYYLRGKIKIRSGKMVLISPQFDKKDARSPHLGRITPIYPTTNGVSSKWLRARIKPLIDMISRGTLIIPETLQVETISRNNLCSISEAISNIHFPLSYRELEIAKKRLGFEEIFKIIEQNEIKRQKLETHKANPIKASKEDIHKFIKQLPFDLTNSQIKVLTECLQDMRKPSPMKRMLQGDTGSGKTVIAAILSLVVARNNKQTVLLAPTSVLAKQHFNSFKNFFAGSDIKISLVTGDSKDTPTDQDIYIGTHALLHRKEKLSQIGLLIVDEQHRFGVKQRNKLLALDLEDRIKPHYLSMTATPIPRSLALTLWSNFDISQITEYPKGRQKVESFLVPSYKRSDSYSWIKKNILEKGNQLFVICPLVEESEALDAKAVKEEYENLSKDIFNEYRVKLLHGKMKPELKDKVLEQFKNHEFDILVSTSVVEVGIDIPNATCILIEGAERFGLAQLHQLRGRVGRRDKKSYCFLFLTDGKQSSTQSLNRLKYFADNHDGFKLAEYDLRTRGPGEVFGTKQSGIPRLKIASLIDGDLIEQVRKEIRVLLREDGP